MIINIKDATSVENQFRNVQEVIVTMLDKLGLPADTEVKIDDISVRAILTIEGEERVLSVPRVIQGNEVDEPFTILCKLDQEGNIDTSVDNEKVSFYEDHDLLKASGFEYKYEGIESEYSADQLEVISHIESAEENEEDVVMAVRYAIKGNDTQELVRYYKGEILVSELLVNKEEAIEEQN